MKMRIAPLAIAIAAASTLTSTATLADGWTINGYGLTNYRMVDDSSAKTTFGKTDYRTAGTSEFNTGQAELTVKKSVQYDESTYADYVLRAEYGNQEENFGSAAGSGDSDAEGTLEVKEAYVLLGNLEFMPEGTQVWAGKRFLNRNIGILSGEYWKQSSGVGTGFEKATANGGKWGLAIMSADPIGGGSNDQTNNTVTSKELYVHGIKGLGGSFDFDAKLFNQADNEVDGTGFSITYNRDYYGMDGWSSTGVSYGDGIATQYKGVNFGNWVAGGDTSKSLFITSYGVANLTENLQLGTEFVNWKLDNIWGQDSVERTLLAVRPSYMVNNNLRIEATYAKAWETLGTPSNWGRADKTVSFNTYEIAAALTANSDYFGRPQIKPYITHYVADDGYGGEIGLANGKNSDTIIGVQAEIWF